MKTIFFRVDGNEIIATGHVMRCISIAKQAVRYHCQVIFVTADDKMHSLIEQQGFVCNSLHSKWNDLESETEQMLSYIDQNKVKLLFVDTYYVTEAYLQALSDHTRVVYLDDLNRFVYPVHTVVNYGIWSMQLYDKERYKKQQLETNFLLGARYIPLREEFENVKYQVHSAVKKVLVTTGGTDQLHVSEKLLEAVMQERDLNGLEYHVIVGCFNKNKDKLYQIAEKYKSVCLHENVTNMAWWMQQCDVAISASGTTLYELAACGIPTICLEVADNQRGAVKWQEDKYMLYAGNVFEEPDRTIEQCLRHLRNYVFDYELRCEYSARMQALIDGKGAGRIAKYLSDLL